MSLEIISLRVLSFSVASYLSRLFCLFIMQEF